MGDDAGLEVPHGWNAQLRDQVDFSWGVLRPRLEGLSDAAYHYEPVPGCWGVRRRDGSTAPMAMGAGDWVIDFDHPEPVPPPLTTIAWRLGHVVVGVLASRNASHFGGPPAHHGFWEFAGTAAEAVAQLDVQYAAWTAGVAALGEEGLARPCGPDEGPFAEHPLSALVLHVNRELLHHLAEVALLMDLHTHAAGAALR